MDNHNRVFGEANNYSGYSGLSYLYHSSILLTQTSSTIATMLGDECKTKWWRGGKTENLVRTPVATIYASKRVTSCADLQPEALWAIVIVDAVILTLPCAWYINSMWESMPWVCLRW